jgi:small subunit ribosomal protein S12
MNFRVSIKQVLARIRVAEKKKDLKVIIVFKKEVIPFLIELRRSGLIRKFVVQQNMIALFLKKTKIVTRHARGQKVLKYFDALGVLHRNPTALIFLSTTFGICINDSFFKQHRQEGGTQLFVAY